MADRKLKAHIFICTNQRESGNPRGCCSARGSEALLDAIKAEVIKRGLRKDVRAQKSGCLDICEDGAAAVIYPQGIWLGKLRPEDAACVLDLATGKENQVPDRLRVSGK